MDVPLVHGAPGWIVCADWWQGVTTGREVANGALGYAYQQGHGFYALPLLPILMAPAVALGDHLGLLQGYPYGRAHPTMWLVVGPYALIWGTLLLHAIRRAAWVRQGRVDRAALVGGRPRSRPIPSVAAAPALAGP